MIIIEDEHIEDAIMYGVRYALVRQEAKKQLKMEEDDKNDR